MNINHHNYEAWFILYMDNELTATERLEVEAFLQDNPLLATELEILNQARLLPDDEIHFENKASLYRHNTTEITTDNYEEYFIASLDNELTASEENELQSFLLLHPALAQQLQVFEQTKLQPDTNIVFPDKASLYRTEKEERVVRIGWWKISVAAAILITFAAGSFYFMQPGNTVNNNVAVIKPVQSIPVQQNNPAVAEDTNTQKASGTRTAVTNNETAAQTTGHEQPIQERNENRQDIAPMQTGNEQKQFAAIDVTEARRNDLQQPLNVPVKAADHASNKALEQTIATTQNINSQPVTNETGGAYNLKASDPTATEPSYVATEEPNNKKIRGFFRKATRIFERTTNISASNDDDKLLVGAFAINLK